MDPYRTVLGRAQTRRRGRRGLRRGPLPDGRDRRRITGDPCRGRAARRHRAALHGAPSARLRTLARPHPGGRRGVGEQPRPGAVGRTGGHPHRARHHPEADRAGRGRQRRAPLQPGGAAGPGVDAPVGGPRHRRTHRAGDRAAADRSRRHGLRGPAGRHPPRGRRGHRSLLLAAGAGRGAGRQPAARAGSRPVRPRRPRRGGARRARCDRHSYPWASAGHLGAESDRVHAGPGGADLPAAARGVRAAGRRARRRAHTGAGQPGPGAPRGRGRCVAGTAGTHRGALLRARGRGAVHRRDDRTRRLAGRTGVPGAGAARRGTARWRAAASGTPGAGAAAAVRVGPGLAQGVHPSVPLVGHGRPSRAAPAADRGGHERLDDHRALPQQARAVRPRGRAHRPAGRKSERFRGAGPARGEPAGHRCPPGHPGARPGPRPDRHDRAARPRHTPGPLPVLAGRGPPRARTRRGGGGSGPARPARRAGRRLGARDRGRPAADPAHRGAEHRAGERRPGHLHLARHPPRERPGTPAHPLPAPVAPRRGPASGGHGADRGRARSLRRARRDQPGRRALTAPRSRPGTDRRTGPDRAHRAAHRDRRHRP